MKEKVLSHSRHRSIDRNYKQAAKAAHLVYVSCDKHDGILREKKGSGFRFLYKGKEVKNKEHLERIRKLAIPPSWKDVWICYAATGHIQATGIDLLGRKQYRYHADWNSLRNETKFHRLYEFGKALPQMRKVLARDISHSDLDAPKVMATVIQLMEETYIRIGNNGYEKLYGSYGLTTLKDKHVDVGQEKIRFSFVGKKGITHSITIRNKRLARIVKQCRNIPGKELFQYYDSQGNRRSVDSGMINHYIKEATGQDFSAKDFRTWAGTLKALEFFRSLPPAESEAVIKKNVVATLDEVSKKLGNSRSICKKYYVHPGLIQLYEEQKLDTCLSRSAASRVRGISREEKDLLHLLKKCI